MAEQTITSTPVNAPDILRNQPLTRQVAVELETQILEPVTFNYESANGGRARFVLPQKGVLDAPNVALVFEVLTDTSDYDLAYPLHIGGLSMIKSATLRCGGNIMSQVNHLNMYSVAKMQFKNIAERKGIYDVRHASHNDYRMRPLNGKIATIAPLAGFQQIYNSELDQVDEYGRPYVAGVNEHQIQKSKCLADTAGQGLEVSVKLSDIFPVLKENRLPLLAMAQCEIEFEFHNCGNGNVAAGNIVDCAVVESAIPMDNTNTIQCIATMQRPNLICDYIHYEDDNERQSIVNMINTTGMMLDFTEVFHTRGRNPADTSVGTGAGTQLPKTAIESQTIIGMAAKEVKKIYVLKDWDLHDTNGVAEREGLLPYNAVAAQRLVQNHRNIVTRQFKSQQMLGEKYNFVINNNKIYNRDVDNAAQQHQYLSQCENSFNVPLVVYDTVNYNADAVQQLCGTQLSNGDTQNKDNTIGATQRYSSGSCHVIGLNLDKYNEFGSMRGNGMRIGSSPVQFNYSCVKVADATAALRQSAAINLQFFVEYRKNMLISPLGVITSDV